MRSCHSDPTLPRTVRKWMYHSRRKERWSSEILRHMLSNAIILGKATMLMGHRHILSAIAIAWTGEGHADRCNPGQGQPYFKSGCRSVRPKFASVICQQHNELTSTAVLAIFNTCISPKMRCWSNLYCWAYMNYSTFFAYTIWCKLRVSFREAYS